MSPRMRTEKVVGYTTMVNRTIVDGLRAVFTDQFPEKQLRNLRFSPDYPLTRTEYPMVLVDFDDRSNKNAGVGHSELFYDERGILREWNHRLFEGTLTLTVMALTTLDRDIIGDALVEMLAFGQMSHMSLQRNLFTRLYGDPDDVQHSPVLRRTLSHISISTDEIQAGGKSASLAPWGPEDVMVFEKSYSLELHGGYYNSAPDQERPGTELVSNVFVYPKLVERIALPIVWDDEENWGQGSVEGSRDASTITATFTASAVDVITP